jgi:hypothetical protein
MDAVYYFMVDVGPVLAPAVLGGCWYAIAMGMISTETDGGTAAAA